MKKLLMFIAGLFLVSQIWSQNASVSSSSPVTPENRNFRIPLIGETAPTFTAESTNGTITFPGDFGRKWKMLFSHPQDFTPVCTTEIIELARLQDELDRFGTKLVVVSTDALETHIQWKKSMESLTLNDNGSVKIKFPLVADANLVIAKMYGMIHPASNTTKSVRGVFIVDPDNIVQAIFFYPKNIGRNTDELLRILAALQTSKEENVLTPVNWKAGNDVLIPAPPSADAAKPNGADALFSPVWYLWYKKVGQTNKNMFKSEN